MSSNAIPTPVSYDNQESLWILVSWHGGEGGNRTRKSLWLKITAMAGLPIDPKKGFQSGGESQSATPAAAAALPENLSEMKTLRHLFQT